MIAQALWALRLAGVDGPYSVLLSAEAYTNTNVSETTEHGYLSHDAGTAQLYLEETLTFVYYTAEASVALTA